MKRTLRWGVAGGAAALLAAVFTISAWPAGATADLGWKFEPTINAPWAHEGDEDEDDAPDVATGLCRWNPFTLPGAYAPTSDIDAIVGDPINNSGTSNFGCNTPQNETAIAVDPGNPNHVVAGSNDYRVCCDFTGLNDSTAWAYTSFNGGATWTNVQVPGLTAQTGGHAQFAEVDAAGDPAMAIGPDGTVYYANIVFSRISVKSGIAVSVSHDGGLTWDQPNMVSWSSAGNYFNDKELIAAGPSGKVVVTWTEFNLGPHGDGYRASPIVMAISKDKGHTWNNQGAPVSDPTRPFDQGSYPVFGPDGTLYVAYEATDPATGYATDATAIARSTDDGKTFTNISVGRVYDDLDCYPIFGGRQTLSGEHFRLNSYPSLGVDPTNGNLAVVWADNKGVGNCGTGGSSFVGTTSAQVQMVSGAWGSLSAPVNVTPAGSGDKVFPAVGTNGGKIAVSYYTRDYASTHSATTCNLATGIGGPSTPPVVTASSVCLDYATRDSSDGFATQTRLTSEGSNPYIQFADGAFIGDYTMMAYGSNGVAHAAWTDFRGRPGTNRANQDVYVANFTP
jgi:hypothetical protein